MTSSRRIDVASDGSLTLRGFSWGDVATILSRLGDMQFATSFGEGAVSRLIVAVAAQEPPNPPTHTVQPPTSATAPSRQEDVGAGSAASAPGDGETGKRVRSSPVLPFIQRVAAQRPGAWLTAQEVMQLCEVEGWENSGTRGADSVRTALDRAFERKAAQILRRTSPDDGRTRIYWLGDDEPLELPISR